MQHLANGLDIYMEATMLFGVKNSVAIFDSLLELLRREEKLIMVPPRSFCCD